MLDEDEDEDDEEAHQPTVDEIFYLEKSLLVEPGGHGCVGLASSLVCKVIRKALFLWGRKSLNEAALVTNLIGELSIIAGIERMECIRGRREGKAEGEEERKSLLICSLNGGEHGLSLAISVDVGLDEERESPSQVGDAVGGVELGGLEDLARI